MTIDRDTWIAARPRSDRRVVVASMNAIGTGNFDLDGITRDENTPWVNYIAGVAKVLAQEGYFLSGMDALVHSTVPIGSGLSSSAALEVAAATMFQQLGKWEIHPVKLALLTQRAENEFVGVSCGILDQYTSILGQAGHAMVIDCRDLTSQPIPIHRDIAIVICDTQAKRDLHDTEYAKRRAECEEGTRRLAAFYPHIRTLRDVTLELLAAHEHDLPEVVARRCRFIVEENQRVLNLASALTTGNQPAIYELAAASYAGARDLYEIGSHEMSLMMEAMLNAPGVIGARQAGAGFGGCMVAFVENNQKAAFADHVKRTYFAASRILPKVYPVSPVSGAGLLPVRY